MQRLHSKITFVGSDSGREIVFNFVNDVTIKTSYEILTDTAKIILPRKITFEGVPITTGTTTLIKRGDSVKIEQGYFPDLRVVFVGFVSKTTPKTPLVIDCEDTMFLLKESTVTNSFTEVSLDTLLADIVPEVVTVENIAKVQNLGKITYSRVTPAAVLKEINKAYGIYSYFVLDANDNPILKVGLASDASDTNEEEYKFEERVIKDSLEFQNSDDVLYRVTCISINTKTNKKVEASSGDDDGQKKTFHYINLTVAECQGYADELVKELKYSGFRGTFTTFGEPYIRPGDIASLVSIQYPEKDGDYQVVSVVRSFGMGGYRQEIELGIRLDPTQ